MCTIRPTRYEDIPTIWEIYIYYVSHTTCTPEITPPTIDEMATRHGKILNMKMPHFVAEEEGSVIGYAYCNCSEPYSAYRFCASLSIYLDKNMYGKGYGRQLLNAVLHEAALVGFRKMLAIVVDSTNTRSIRLHQSAGFTLIAVYKSRGWKFNRWLDTVVLEKSIGEGDATPPE